MRVCFENSKLVVIDDFLSPAQFRRVSRGFGAEAFKLIHVPEIQSVFRPGDGTPLDGSAVMKMSGAVSDYTSDRKARTEQELPFFVYPTGKPVDLMLDKVSQVAKRFARVLGREGEDWVAIQGKPFLYPMGTGLGWHDDGRVYASAFAYYAHPEWDPDWGGELIVATDSQLKPTWKRSPFGDARERKAIMREGLGVYVLPKPNRMVFLKGGTLHRISPVTASAGSHLRASIAGFLVTKVGVRGLLAAS